MAVSKIDFNEVIKWSKANCFSSSQGKCAEYVKNAFVAGGCTYYTGSGFWNQQFCKQNGFECVGNMTNITDGNPREHDGIAIQFPTGYTQQTGDICLIKHGSPGHICYAAGPNIDDWVSDYWQHSPAQKDGTGPYCYGDSGYLQVCFFRHSSCLNGAPVVDVTLDYVGNGSSTVTEPLPILKKPSGNVSSESIKTMGDYSFGHLDLITGTHIRQSK